MVKTAPPEDTLKKRKKSAKKEAKLMLKVEQAKSEVQKAEQQIQADQSTLKSRTYHLQDLEQALTKLLTPTQTSPQSPPEYCRSCSLRARW